MSTGAGYEIAVFAKAPVPGRTKTRLIPAIGEDAAAALHRAFLDDTLRAACRLAPVTLFVTAEHPVLSTLAKAHGVRVAAQIEGDLGARMQHALADLTQRAGCGVVLGSDSPSLPARYIEAAGRADLAFGPTADGGFYTVAGRRAPDFEGVPWSSPTTLEQTLKCNPRASLLPPWFDVDTPEDLALLRAQLVRNSGAAPSTARALAELGR